MAGDALERAVERVSQRLIGQLRMLARVVERAQRRQPRIHRLFVKCVVVAQTWSSSPLWSTPFIMGGWANLTFQPNYVNFGGASQAAHLGGARG